MIEAYKDAKVELPKNLTKRNKENQKNDAVNYIKTNSGCTVVQIQKNAKVNLVRTFGSILNAYKAADAHYPEKEVTSGVRNPYAVKRCHDFEKRIFGLLEGLGTVRTLVRNKAGIADCVFRFNDTFFVVEIKDFRGKNNITMHEIGQLIRYMGALKCNNGILICPKENFPKRKYGRNVYIDGLNILILSEEDLRECSIRGFINPYNLAIIAGSSKTEQ